MSGALASVSNLENIGAVISDTQFDALDDELHRAVGRMVHRWSQLESWLGSILTLLLVGNASGRQGPALYYEVPNLRSRIGLVRAAFAERDDLPLALQAQWSAIVDAIEAEIPERNEVIFGDFIQGFTDQPVVGIVPKRLSEARHRHPPEGSTKLGFDAADVERHADRLALLRDALWALHMAMPMVIGAAPPQTADGYIDQWTAARAIREWPSKS